MEHLRSSRNKQNLKKCKILLKRFRTNVLGKAQNIRKGNFCVSENVGFSENVGMQNGLVNFFCIWCSRKLQFCVKGKTDITTNILRFCLLGKFWCMQKRKVGCCTTENFSVRFFGKFLVCPVLKNLEIHLGIVSRICMGGIKNKICNLHFLYFLGFPKISELQVGG